MTTGNPISPAPVYRRAFQDIHDWVVDGVEPAEDVYLDGQFVPMMPYEPVLDDDGNQLGGLRLPHMPRDDGSGAPLGVYGSLNPDYGPPWEDSNPAMRNVGTFEPFSKVELLERYPDRETYVEKVTAAADAVLAEGYILQEDRDLYVSLAEAADYTLPEVPAPEDDDGAATSLCGHGCQPTPMNEPEGGQLRIELVRSYRDATEVRSFAWFASNQAPETRPWPRPPAEWDIEDGPTLCKRVADGEYFPNGRAESRIYLDAGSTVTLTHEDGDLVLNKQEAVEDWSNNVLHEIVYTQDFDPLTVPLDAWFGIETAGSSEMAAMSIENGLHLPATYDVLFPNMRDRVYLRSDRDLPVVWNYSGSRQQFNYAFVSFSDVIGPVYFCIGPQSGQMTIPSSVIADIPRAGLMVHGVLNHNAIATEEGRTLHFVGANCEEAEYTVDAAL